MNKITKNIISLFLSLKKKLLFWRRGKQESEAKKEARKYKKISRMKFSSILLIGYRNILVNRTRSVLTIGGVAVGIGIITFLICLGFGLQEMVVREVTENSPLDIIDINNGNLDHLISLSDENIGKINNIPGVVEAERIVNTGGKMYYGESQTDMIIYGTTKRYFDLAKMKSAEGDLAPEDKKGKVIVSSRLAEFLGFDNPSDMLREKVKYDIVISGETNADIKESLEKTDNEAEVVAIIDDEDRAVAYFYYPFLSEEFGVNLAQSGKIKVESNSNVGEIMSQIEHIGFLAENVKDVVADINNFFLIIKIALIVFGVIIMSISAMGMLNTLSVSLLQRTKEVGILKALGTKRGDIFVMFIFEAAIISFLGGIMGFFGGYGAAKAVNGVFNLLATQRGMEAIGFVYVPHYFILAMVCFIAFLGFATGIMPAKRASKIHALDALRYE